MESPTIVTKDNRYFIKFRYGKDAFLFTIQSKIENDKLILYLPVTTSTGHPGGRVSIQEITESNELALVKSGKIFWEEPDKNLILLKVLVDQDIPNGLDNR